MTLLIADDSALLRERIKILAKATGNVKTIYEAENGVEAMQIINNKKPNLVILDIRMPLMNGIKVLERIKKEGIKTKVCILTSYNYRQYREKCTELGADYFFNKNDDIQQLVDLIKKLSKGKSDDNN
jgi:DNA-binding NarL/FixJ family response regulator